MATHSSILAGKSHGQRSLVGYSQWGCEELVATERLTLSFFYFMFKSLFGCTGSQLHHVGPFQLWHVGSGSRMRDQILTPCIRSSESQPLDHQGGPNFHPFLQFSSVAQWYPTLCDPMNRNMQASLSIANSQSLLKLISIELVMPSNHLIFCHPLLVLPSTFPSIRVFSNESVLRIRWPEYWSFSFSISPSSECSGLISFSVDCLDLLEVKGTLKSLLQYQGSKASIRCSAFFIVQLSQPYMTTGKTTALTRWTFFWQSNVSAF